MRRRNSTDEETQHDEWRTMASGEPWRVANRDGGRAIGSLTLPVRLAHAGE
jgi:hypothetical protein